MARHQVMGLLLLVLITLLVRSLRAEPRCLCQTSGCLCCVELNLTSSIDLGGPACVNIRQRERNVSLNLSYADNPVHNATIVLDEAANKPTCMNLLSDLAQICAKFVSMRRPTQGEQWYTGCLVIEPALLGAPQATYPVGCFTFDRGQVRKSETPIILPQEPDKKPDEVHEQEQEQEEEEEEDQGLNAEELIAAVSASAEQGIALFSQWLGLNITPISNRTKANTSESEPSKVEHPVVNTNVAAGRHARNLAILVDNEDKHDERFKQLLSAQDNILKESAKIGAPPKGHATTFFYSQPDAEEVQKTYLEATISPENLVIVPSDSRRGGRAYNIHQHVNEI